MKIEIKELILSNKEIGIGLSVSEDEIIVNEYPTFIESEEIPELIDILSLAKKIQNSLLNGNDQELLKDLL